MRHCDGLLTKLDSNTFGICIIIEPLNVHHFSKPVYREGIHRFWSRRKHIKKAREKYSVN